MRHLYTHITLVKFKHHCTVTDRRYLPATILKCINILAVTSLCRSVNDHFTFYHRAGGRVVRASTVIVAWAAAVRAVGQVVRASTVIVAWAAAVRDGGRVVRASTVIVAWAAAVHTAVSAIARHCDARVRPLMTGLWR